MVDLKYIACFLAIPLANGFAADYLHDVKPVLKARCYACHGALKQKAGLRLDTAAMIRQGSKEGPIVISGDAPNSRLFHRISATSKDERMPPEGEALKPAQVAAIREWIANGAPAPADEKPEDDPSNHWAYQPIQKPEVLSNGKRSPVDAFLSAKHKALGLKPQPRADKSLLLRRVHLNLTGLAPTQAELRSFLDDRSPDAYEKVVGALLKSRHYGERWGRHWMDVWRYSDWYGLGAQLRTSQKHMWHWRDWIIDSLNDDKGYDRMVLEMIAGDELDPKNPEVVAGTGYLARNYYLFNRTTWLDNTIEHTSKAFLAMTMNCAKCHDHKYDPLEHEDYYKMRAIFEPHQVRLDAISGQLDFEKDGLPRAFDDHVDAPTYVHLKGNEKDADKSRKILPGLPKLFGPDVYKLKPIELPRGAFAPGSRTEVRETAVKTVEAKIAAARKKVESAGKALAKVKTQNNTEATAISERVERKQSGFKDDFSKRRDDTWKIEGAGWEYRDGALHQTTSGRSNNLRSKKPHPRDFYAKFEYTTTGGATYRSIGIRFDAVNGGKDHNMVYTSAHAPGSKVQVSHGKNGQSSYPSNGRVGRKIEIGHRYSLELRVRDHLLNISLDGEFQLAYALPNRDPNGVIELTAFDATAIFHSLEVSELDPTEKLIPAGGKSSGRKVVTKEDAVRQLKLVEMELKAAEAELSALKARIKADDSRFEATDAKPVEELAKKAAAEEARYNVVNLEWQAESKKGNATEFKKIEVQLKSARNKLKSPGAKYTLLAGSKKGLETPAHKFGDYEEVFSRISTGRRLALANWIIGDRNPLTARVAVNHIWMRHFGTPLVESVFDFGLRAKKPIHSDLLDWLAADFMEHGWSMKHLHLVIVTSEAYQRTSSTLAADTSTVQHDSDNAYYWRMAPRRMESQIVRDNLLHIAGTLDREFGGPAIDAKKRSTRRSIYFRHGRDDVNQFVSMFDDADFLQCYRRFESVVPQQALALANSALSLESAAKMAERISGKTAEEIIIEAFEMILSRRPDHYEIAECEAFLQGLEQASNKDRNVRLVHALLNHNDFVTIR